MASSIVYQMINTIITSRCLKHYPELTPGYGTGILSFLQLRNFLLLKKRSNLIGHYSEKLGGFAEVIGFELRVQLVYSLKHRRKQAFP